MFNPLIQKNNDEKNNQVEISELLAEIVKKNNGCIVFNIFEAGSQHVDSIQTQNVYSTKRQDTPKYKDTSAKESFNDDTPLSELYRKTHQKELRTVIESWRPYLMNDNTGTDALSLSHFEFDKDRIYSNKVYRDLCGLDALGALQVSLSQLARYLADHSNLSRSYATLYQQLKYYRSECYGSIMSTASGIFQ